MIGSDDFRAIAKRIAALSAIQVRTSESVSQVMKDLVSSDELPGVPKSAVSNRATPSNPDDDHRKPPESLIR